MDEKPECNKDVNAGCEPLQTEQMEVLAHALWVERGCPIGSPEVDWFEAERRLTGLEKSTKVQTA